MLSTQKPLVILFNLKQLKLKVPQSQQSRFKCSKATYDLCLLYWIVQMQNVSITQEVLQDRLLWSLKTRILASCLSQVSFKSGALSVPNSGSFRDPAIPRASPVSPENDCVLPVQVPLTFILLYTRMPLDLLCDYALINLLQLKISYTENAHTPPGPLCSLTQ